jgi:hypothetical protein
LILVLFLHNSHFCHLKNLHHAIPSCFVDCWGPSKVSLWS